MIRRIPLLLLNLFSIILYLPKFIWRALWYFRSIGRIFHPTLDLYDLSLYLYCFFKMRKVKCCTKIFIQGFHYIYECSGCTFPNIDNILKRFKNCVFKGYATNETDKIFADKAKENCKRKRKLNSWSAQTWECVFVYLFCLYDFRFVLLSYVKNDGSLWCQKWGIWHFCM